MKRCRIASVLLALLVISAASFAQNISIRVTTFPTIAVADGKSTVTVTAEVREGGGRPVRDGTTVIFESTQGSFENPIVTTLNGMAHAILTSSSVPGTAIITVKLADASAPPSTLELDFVANRQMLSAYRDFIEIYGGERLAYMVDRRIVSAAGGTKPAEVRYRDIEISGADIQVDIPSYEVRARNATVKIGRTSHRFDQLVFKLNERRGFGTAPYEGEETKVGIRHRLPYIYTEPRLKYGTLSIDSSGVKPTDTEVSAQNYAFIDASESPSIITSQRIVAFPRREIQFTRADIYVGTHRVLQMPHYVLNLNSVTPIITDQFINVTGNQLSVNYPYYLSVRPGFTSAVRLSTGQVTGRNFASNNGIFLNYEMNWNRGDEMEGYVTLGGIGRRDWGISARQYWQFDPRSNLAIQADLPSGRSIFGSLQATRAFTGFQTNLNVNATSTLRGEPFTNQSATLSLDSDPRRVGELPLRYSFGLAVNHNAFNTRFANASSDTIGPRMRLTLLPRNLSPSSRLTGSFNIGYQTGHNAPRSGFAFTGNLMMTQQLNRQASLLIGYDYVQDGFSQSFLGRHRMNAQLNYGFGRSYARFMASRSLDINKFSYYGDFSYLVSNDWRIAYTYTYDQYLRSSFSDGNILIGYGIGWREIGVTFSQRTRRFGLVFGNRI